MFKGCYSIKKDSPIHQLDPRSKLIFIFLVILTNVFLNNLSLLTFLIFVALLYMLIANILKECRLILIFFLTTSIFICLIVFIYSKNVTDVIRAAKFCLKMLSITIVGFTFAFTTTPSDLSKSLEKIKIPRFITFVTVIAVRFFPVLLKEIQYIMDSMKLKGLKPRWMYLRNPRFVFIPLTIRMIKLSDELSMAAESKGFGNPCKRGSLKEIKFRRSDYLFLAIIIVLCFTIIIFDKGIIPWSR